jgi:hypothetical protein
MNVCILFSCFSFKIGTIGLLFFVGIKDLLKKNCSVSNGRQMGDFLTFEA